MVEKILTYALEKHDLGSAQDWRISSELWSPENGIFLGTLPPFLSFYDQQRELAFASQKFFSSIFSNLHLLFLQKGCSAAHESVFFKHPSVQEITQLQFPFPAIWNWKERQRQQHASIDPTSCQREKLLFEFKKGFYISFWKKAHLELLSVYPTYPFTFYVNPTKRYVTWSICLCTHLFIKISVLTLFLLYSLWLEINCPGALLRFIVQHRNLMIFCILRYTIFSGFFQFLIPIIIITVIYLRILLFLKVKKHKVLKVYLYMEIACFLCFFCYFFFLQRNRVSQPSLLAKQRKTNAILFSISLIFFVTWLPFRWLLPLLCILSVSRDISSG